MGQDRSCEPTCKPHTEHGTLSSAERRDLAGANILDLRKGGRA
jgi:hypothetical protein